MDDTIFEPDASRRFSRRREAPPPSLWEAMAGQVGFAEKSRVGDGFGPGVVELALGILFT